MVKRKNSSRITIFFCLLISPVCLLDVFFDVVSAEEEKETFEMVTRGISMTVPLPIAEQEAAEEEDADAAEPIEPIEYVMPIPENINKIMDLPRPYQLNADEVVVYDYEDLNNALSNDNGITKVYFGADITMTDGIDIHANKTELEISGFNPNDPAQTKPYTLTDLSSTAQDGTIWIPAGTSLTTLLVKDLNIIGKNGYSPISVVDNSNTAGLTITYERVNYNGPVFGYHRQGTLRFIDCNAHIHGNNSDASTNEFAEVKDLIFEGDNTIYTEISDDSVFLHAGGGNFTVLDNSSVTLNAPNLNTYGVFYADAAGNTVNISIGKGACFNIQEAYRPLTHTSTAIGSLTVDDGGAFYARVTRDGEEKHSYVMRVTGDILIGKDASFHVVTANQNYEALLLVDGDRTLMCTDPASVLLYSPNGRIMRSTSRTCALSLNAQQVNTWSSVGSGNLDDAPRYHWQNETGNVTINADIGVTASTVFVKHTYKGNVKYPGVSTFSMLDTRVLSCGRLNLTIDELDDLATSITGMATFGTSAAAPGATVRASYQLGGSSGAMPDVAAGEDGTYSVMLDSPYAQDTEVTVISAFRYLFAEKYTVVQKADVKYIVSLSLDDAAAAWDDLAGHIAVTFFSDFLKQTVIFNQQVMEYYGFPNDSSANAIDVLGEGTWTVSANLPVNYYYKVYKNDEFVGHTLNMYATDITTDCHIRIEVYKTQGLPWGRWLYRSINH